jgi:hypothetical protein
MHEGLTWREVVDKYQSTMVDELGAAVDSLIAAEREAESIRAAAERERVKLATAESLNQIVRRIRQSATWNCLPKPRRLMQDGRWCFRLKTTRKASRKPALPPGAELVKAI